MRSKHTRRITVARSALGFRPSCFAPRAARMNRSMLVCATPRTSGTFDRATDLNGRYASGLGTPSATPHAQTSAVTKLKPTMVLSARGMRVSLGTIRRESHTVTRRIPAVKQALQNRIISCGRTFRDDVEKISWAVDVPFVTEQPRRFCGRAVRGPRIRFRTFSPIRTSVGNYEHTTSRRSR